MRHRMHGRKLGRTSAHRKAMFRNQLVALFEHERIVTTLPKAKELRPLAERMVTLARAGTLANRRRILTMVPDKDVVQKLFDEIAPRFMERPGGYTRILRLGRRRGDGAELAIIEFIDFELDSKEHGGGSGKGSLMDRARGMFGGRKQEAGPAEKAEKAEAEEPEAEATAPAEEPEAEGAAETDVVASEEPAAEEPAEDEKK
jgi:large subunit ribosomal protein L17